MSQATAAGKSRLVSTPKMGGHYLATAHCHWRASWTVLGRANARLHVGLQYRAGQMPIIVKQSHAIRQLQQKKTTFLVISTKGFLMIC